LVSVQPFEAQVAAAIRTGADDPPVTDRERSLIDVRESER
jgi:hypothetical protein